MVKSCPCHLVGTIPHTHIGYSEQLTNVLSQIWTPLLLPIYYYISRQSKYQCMTWVKLCSSRLKLNSFTNFSRHTKLSQILFFCSVFYISLLASHLALAFCFSTLHSTLLSAMIFYRNQKQRSGFAPTHIGFFHSKLV